MKTQKTLSTLLLLFVCSLVVNAQESIEKEVNQQIWQPFIESWTANDAERFNALHTDDVLRASARGIRVGKEYKAQNIQAFNRNKQSTAKRSISFWLEHRVYSGNVGYEVGYYKITYQAEGQKAQNYYSRFHIVLKKIDGVWKIAQDWDTSNINGHEVSESDWLKGKPLSF